MFLSIHQFKNQNSAHNYHCIISFQQPQLDHYHPPPKTSIIQQSNPRQRTLNPSLFVLSSAIMTSGLSSRPTNVAEAVLRRAAVLYYPSNNKNINSHTTTLHPLYAYTDTVCTYICTCSWLLASLASLYKSLSFILFLSRPKVSRLHFLHSTAVATALLLTVQQWAFETHVKPRPKLRSNLRGGTLLLTSPHVLAERLPTPAAPKLHVD